MQQVAKNEQSVLSTYLIGKRHGILKIQHELHISNTIIFQDITEIRIRNKKNVQFQ